MPSGPLTRGRSHRPLFDGRKELHRDHEALEQAGQIGEGSGRLDVGTPLQKLGSIILGRIVFICEMGLFNYVDVNNFRCSIGRPVACIVIINSSYYDAVKTKGCIYGLAP